MKKRFNIILAVFAGLFISAPAASAQTPCPTGTDYLYVACADHMAANWWTGVHWGENWYWHYRRSYHRVNRGRINVLGQGWGYKGNTSGYGCRWIIVNKWGSTVGQAAYWHPDYVFVPGCGGV